MAQVTSGKWPVIRVVDAAMPLLLLWPKAGCRLARIITGLQLVEPLYPALSLRIRETFTRGFGDTSSSKPALGLSGFVTFILKRRVEPFQRLQIQTIHPHSYLPLVEWLTKAHRWPPLRTF